MRRFIAFVLLVSCVLLASLAAPAQKNAEPTQKKKHGAAKQPPKIVVTPVDTEALKTLLTQQRERPLLVNFWATFCDPCRDEFPDLVKIDKDFRPQSLDFVTISLDDMSDINTTVPEFLGAMKATMPAYLLNASDPEPAINLVDTAWRGDLPATYLYNEKGEIVYKHIGRVKAEELRSAIEKLVKKGNGQK